MNIKTDKLKLLSLAEKFKVTDRDVGYDVDYIGEFEGEQPCAFIADDGIDYFVKGVYNSGSDYAQIDPDAVAELMKFCEMITEE